MLDTLYASYITNEEEKREKKNIEKKSLNTYILHSNIFIHKYTYTLHI